MTQTATQIRRELVERMSEYTITPDHDKTGHWYRVGDQRFASVTTKHNVLSAGPHLKVWSARLAIEHFESRYFDRMKGMELEDLKMASILAHQSVFEDAGDIGTIIHGWIDDFMQADMRRIYDSEEM